MANTKSSKKNTSEVVEETTSIEPTSVEVTEQHSVIANAEEKTIEVPIGHVLVGQIDEAGNDTNSDFFVTEKVYKKYFANDPKFIKKNTK